MEYLYANGPLLDTPNAYTYTAYGGRLFLCAWRRDRDRVSTILGSPTAPPPATPDRNAVDGFMERLSAGCIIDVDALFEAVMAELERGVNPDDDHTLRIVIDRLVQKFEVAKRWYPAYVGVRFRAVQAGDHEACRSLERYIRAAEVFDAVYATTFALPYLNVFLKSVDTLCALHETIDTELRGRLSRLINHEAVHVVKLAAKLRIEITADARV